MLSQLGMSLPLRSRPIAPSLRFCFIHSSRVDSRKAADPTSRRRSTAASQSSLMKLLDSCRSLRISS